MNITELTAIRNDAQAAIEAQVNQSAIEATSNEVSFVNEYESFTIEATKSSDLPKIDKFIVKERGVYGRKGEECHGKFYVIVRVQGEWFDLPAFCERFKCKCAGQNGFTDRDKAMAFGKKALAKWGVGSPKASVIVRVQGEWFDLPAFCERFKCKCAGQNGFTDRDKAKAFGEKALAKWGVESAKTSNGAASVLKELGYEYDKKSRKWVKNTIEHRK